jgi:hypothetical protein
MNINDLKNALIERFKLEAYIQQLEKEMARHAEEFTFEKYKGTIILRGGLQYELFAVYAETFAWRDDIEPGDVRLTLIYTIISKIKIHEKKALLRIKNEYPNRKYMNNYSGQKKLFIKEIYEIEPELVVKNEINLNIGITKEL